MTKFNTRAIWPFNKRESYDSIETTWPDKTCLTIMIVGSLMVSLISYLTLNNPVVPQVEAHIEPIVEDTQKVVVKKEYIDTVQDDALELILRFEWLHTTSYWDVRRWSIGCGTYSYQWEVITREEAINRCKTRIDDKRRQYDLYKHPDHIEIALLSFEHNLWKMPHAYKWYLENWHKNALGNLMKQYTYAGWEFMRGLYNRRVAEVDILTNWYEV